MITEVGRRYLVAGKLGVKISGDGVIIRAELTNPILIDFDFDGRRHLRPIHIDQTDFFIFLHQLHDFIGVLLQLLGIRTGQTIHDRIRRRRTGLNQANIAADIGKMIR